MSFEKILRYTGLFGNKDASKAPKELKIEGDCTITNYDTRTNKKPPAYVKVQSYNNSIFIEEGAKSDTTPDVADFSNKKALILERIARDSILSLDDILAIGWKEDDKQKNIATWNKELGLNITDYKVDHNNGVLTVKWGENDILRIDFSEFAKQNALKEKPIKEEEIRTSKETPEDSKKIPKTHTVKLGETLSAIAKEYGIPLSNLIKLNIGLKPDQIKEGQVIRLQAEENSESPKRATSSEKQNDLAKTTESTKTVKQDSIQKVLNQNETKVYKIKKGDTLEKIAKRNNLFEWELRRANPNIKKWSEIRYDQKIIIPSPTPLAKFDKLTATEQAFLERLKARESGGERDPYRCVAGSYLGAYQIGPDILKKFDITVKGKWGTENRFGVKSKKEFFDSPQKQLQIAVASMQNNWDFLTIGNADDNFIKEKYPNMTFDIRNYIGKSINYKGKKYLITESGALAAAHLLGPYTLIEFLINPKTTIKLTDGNGTHITEYLQMQGYDLSKMLDIY